MNAIQQYIDLWREHGDLIKSHSPAALNALRHAAAEAATSMTLPGKGVSDYPYTDLDGMLAPDYGLNLARIPMEVDPSASFRCEVPRLSTSLFFLVNDSFRASQTAWNGLPEGVEVSSLAAMAESDPDFISDYYGKAADIGNPIVALNTMFCQDGFVLRVRKGVKVSKPLQLVQILHSLMPFMAVRRILVIMEPEAEATLLVCDHTQVPEVDLMGLQTIEIFAGRNSRFDFYDLEETTDNTRRLSSLYLRQEQGSRVLIDGITLFNGTTRNEYFSKFEGDDASLRLLGMAIEDGDRQQETYSRIEHMAKRCHTDELFKFVVDDRARGSFVGRIKVCEGASGTEAYQSNRNLLGSDTARMHSKPELEIYNDDVKCSHGTAIGQLDPMQLFYMRTRGLDEASARLLLKQAFMSDVIAGVTLEPLADRLRHLVEMRFAGTLSSACGGCRNCALS